MNFVSKVKSLLEEKGNSKNIVVLDLDGTLFETVKNSVKIYVKDKSGRIVGIEPKRYDDKAWKEKYLKTGIYSHFDGSFKDFRDEAIMEKSILTAKPIVSVLRKVDALVNAGWDVAILTARGAEKGVWEGLRKRLKFRVKNKLQSIEKLALRGNIMAINDDEKRMAGIYTGKKSAEIQKLLDQGYEKVLFIDDSHSNLVDVRKNAKTREGQTLRVIDAKKLQNKLSLKNKRFR